MSGRVPVNGSGRPEVELGGGIHSGRVVGDHLVGIIPGSSGIGSAHQKRGILET